MSDERKLKEAIKSGNSYIINLLFEELYNRYIGLVCFVIAKYIKSKEDVYDIAQEVFLDFFNGAEKLNSNIKYYLTTMAKNKAINHLKKQSKITLVEMSEIDLLDEKMLVENYLYYDTLKRLKDNLSQIEYSVLILHIFENFTFKEISIKLNSKESSIKSLYFRTLKKCQKIFKKEKK